MDLRLKQAGGHASSSASASASAPVPVPAPGHRNETPRQSGKRPMRSLTAEEKVSAIDRVHNGESKAAVARDMGVPESTLRGWCKSEEKLRSQARNTGTFERPSPINSESDRSPSQTPPPDNSLSASGSTKRELSREDTSGLTVKRARYDNNATFTVGDVGLAAGGPASSRTPYFNGNYRNNGSTTYPNVFPMNIGDLTSSSVVNQQLQNQEFLKQTLLRSIMPFALNNENGMSNHFNQVLSQARLVAATLTTNMTMANGVNNNSTTKNKRKNNHTTQIHTSKTAYKHRLSPDIEKPSTSGSRGTSPIASTSTTNGPSNEQTPVRPTKEAKGINDIVRNLMTQQQQQTQQLQQSGGYQNDFFNLCNIHNYDRNVLDTISNNNNIYNTNENGFIADLPESKQTNLEEAIRCSEKLLNFMDKHGQPIFTFSQVDTVRNIYIKLREHKEKNEFKKNETYTS